ncbi:MAG: tryptophan--tRNA ligase, partial [Cyanobacteria bacterium J06631_9]
MNRNDKVVLTGIKPTGTPHLGNYVGAIKPALAMAKDARKSLMFIADYHAINSVRNPEVLKASSREIAATFIALGLDTEKTIFYRQSDVPEIFELTIALAAIAPKGMMNRAHAYKAAIGKNRESGKTDLE